MIEFFIAFIQNHIRFISKQLPPFFLCSGNWFRED